MKRINLIVGFLALLLQATFAEAQPYYSPPNVSGGRATNGNPIPLLVDDAGAVIMSNPGTVTLGADAGITVNATIATPNVVDAGSSFNGVGTAILGRDTAGKMQPINLDSDGGLIISGSVSGGGGTSANVQDAGIAFNRAGSNTLGVAANGVSFPVLVDDAGAVVISNPGSGGGGGSVTISGQPIQVYFDGGSLLATVTGTVTANQGATAYQIQLDGGFDVVVKGRTASGNPPTDPPVLIGGISGVNIQPFRVSNDGSLVVALRTGTSPQVPTVASFAANASTEVTPLPVGGCLYITCNREVWYVTGVTPITAAVNTSTHFPTDKSDLVFCLASTETDVAFITDDARGGSCSVSILNSP